MIISNTRWKDCKSRKNLCTKNFTYTKKFYAHGIAAVNLAKIYFAKNTKKTCKPNNLDLNCDWMIQTLIASMVLSKSFSSHLALLWPLKFYPLPSPLATFMQWSSTTVRWKPVQTSSSPMWHLIFWPFL